MKSHLGVISSNEIFNDNFVGISNDLREGYVSEVVEDESEEDSNNGEWRFEGNFERKPLTTILMMNSTNVN